MASIATLSRLSAVLTLDITRFMTNSERVSLRLQKLRKEAVAFGQGFSRSFSFAFALVSAGAIKVAADFDQLQAQLEAVTGGDGLTDLTAQAKQLGRETVFTAREVANLQLELSKLGFASGEVANAVVSATDITAVFGGDLVKTGTSIAEAVRQFSNENLDASRVADVMAVAFQNTALSTDNFSQALKNVGSVANITGNDFETTVALLGLLANAGQKGGIAGTRLKGVFIRLGKQLGVTGEELNLLTSGQLDFNQLIEIFRNRAGVAAAVISELGDEFQVLKQQILDSNGASAALASGLDDRLFFSLRRIQAATEAIGISIGEAFTPALKGIADLLGDFASDIEKADKGTVQFVVSLAALVAILPPLTFLLTQLVTGIAAVFAGGFATAAAVLIAVGAAVVNAGVSFSQTQGKIDKARDGVVKFAADLNEAAEKSVETFTKRIEVLNEELDKVAGDDRLGTEEKIEASENLRSAIADLESQLEGFVNFDTADFDSSFEDFKGVVDGSVVSLAQLKRRLQEVQDQQEESARFIEEQGIGQVEAAAILRPLEAEELRIQAKISVAQGPINEAAADVQQAFDNIDFEIFSPAQIQAEITKLEKLVTGLDEAEVALQALEDSSLDRGIVQLGESLSALGGFFNPFGDGFLVGAEAEVNGLEGALTTLTTVQARLIALDEDRANLTEFIADLQEELNKKLEEQNRLAEEAQKLSDSFADLFPSDADAKAAIEAFDKLKEGLIETQAEFGQATGRFEQAGETISALSDKALNLQRVLQFKDLGTDLFANFRGTSDFNIEERLKGVKESSKLLKDFVAQQLAVGRVDLALIFQDIAKEAENLEKKLELIAFAKELDETTDNAIELANALSEIDVISEAQALREIVSAIENRLRGRQEKGLFISEDEKKRLQDARDLLKEAERIVKNTDLQVSLGEADPRLTTPASQLERRIQGLEAKGASILRELNEEFNKLDRKDTVLDEAFSFGDDNVVSLVSVNRAIADLNTQIDSGVLKQEELQAAIARRDSFVAFRDTIVDINQRLGENARQIAEVNTELEQLENQTAFSELDTQLDAIPGNLERGLLTPLEAAQERFKLLSEQLEIALGDESVLGPKLTLDGLKGLVVDAKIAVEELERLEQLAQFLQQQVSFIGDAFVQAADGTKKFGEALGEGFKRAITALIGQLITLIVLFGILAAFGVVAFNPKALGNFLSAGLGLPTTRSTGGALGIGTGGVGTPELAVRGTISGSNIVISNQRGTRAIDRTFG